MKSTHTRNFFLLTALALAMVLASAGDCRADREEIREGISTARKRIADLEKEMRSLREEVERLREAIGDARETVTARIAAAETPKLLYDPSKTPSKTYSTIRALFALLPDAAGPDNSDWSETSRESALVWLRENVVGEAFEMKLKVAWVKTGKEPVSTSEKGVMVWEQEFHFQQVPLRFERENLRFTIRGLGTDPITIQNQDATARRAARLKSGQLVTLTGRIADFTIRDRDGNTRDVLVHLGHHTVTSRLLN